ncbi:MAG: hypothetical protein ACR2F8_09875 [Caulobacteraceae bacterium]
MSETSKWKEEVYAAFLANRTMQERMTREERFAAGEFSIDLVPTSDEPADGDPAFQDGLSSFGATVRAAGVPLSQTAIAFDAADANGYPLPEFIVAIKALGPPAITALAAAAGAWAQARFGRKVRLKVGDVEAEGRTVAEIEKLLNMAAEFQDRGRDASGDE